MYKSLIQNINNLLLKEKVQKQERFERGEDFNIFRIMHMESDEVYTHSAVIAELLNPRGSHGCGDTFLRLFLELLPSAFDLPFDTQNATTEVEVVIGEITDEEGGRMDVLVQSNGQAIIIENKIYAGDQRNQLLRYYNYAEKQYKKGNYKLLYLTLDGKSPSESSTGKRLVENEDYYCISYAGEIRKWLMSCLTLSVQKPLVREIIVQYINLINKLTHQDMESNVKAELLELCSNPQNMEALLWISNNFSIVVQKIMENEFLPQLQEIADKNGYKLSIKNDGKDWLNTPWMSFSFRKEEWTTFEISFEFQSQQMKNCISGFRHQIEDPTHAYTKRRDVFDVLRGMDLANKVVSSKRWPIYHYFPYKNNNWISESMMQMILDDKHTLQGEIQKELLALAAKAEELKINL